MTRIISIVGGLQPSTPTIGTATDGGTGTSVNVAFTPSTYIGKGTITYTATSSPGGFTGTSATSPISVTGLTTGTAYTFTVRGTTNYGVTSLTSGSSNSVTPANPDVGVYYPLSAITVGTNAPALISFTNIPATYTHLQLRGIARSATTGSGGNFGTYIRINSDSGNNYAFHQLWGNGSSVQASAGTSQNVIYTLHAGPRAGDLANAFSAQIIDFLDYANTNKFKTVRTLGGHNLNNTSAQRIALTSGLWRSTSAISRIDFYVEGNIGQFTEMALYGIKGV